MLIFSAGTKAYIYIYVIAPHRYGTGIWNPFSYKARTFQFNIANIVGANILATLKEITYPLPNRWSLRMDIIPSHTLYNGCSYFSMLELYHYNDVIMNSMASQITSLAIVYSTVYSGAGQRKHQSSASLTFVRGIHRWPLNSPHKEPVTRKIIPFDDVIMLIHVSKMGPIFLDITGILRAPHGCTDDQVHDGQLCDIFPSAAVARATDSCWLWENETNNGSHHSLVTGSWWVNPFRTGLV